MMYQMICQIILTVATLIFLATPSMAGEKTHSPGQDPGRNIVIYDKHWNVERRIQDGIIYDKNWNTKGHIEGGRIYDRGWNSKGTIIWK